MVTERTDEDGDERSTNRQHPLAWIGAAGGAGIAGYSSGGSSQWADLSRMDDQRAAVAAFEGNAFAASSPENPKRQRAVNATLNFSVKL